MILKFYNSKELSFLLKVSITTYFISSWKLSMRLNQLQYRNDENQDYWEKIFSFVVTFLIEICSFYNSKITNFVFIHSWKIIWKTFFKQLANYYNKIFILQKPFLYISMQGAIVSDRNGQHRWELSLSQIHILHFWSLYHRGILYNKKKII